LAESLAGVFFKFSRDGLCFGLGGTDDGETKLKKSKSLAKKALQRL